MLGGVDGVVSRDLTEKTEVSHLTDLVGSYEDISSCKILWVKREEKGSEEGSKGERKEGGREGGREEWARNEETLVKSSKRRHKERS